MDSSESDSGDPLSRSPGANDNESPAVVGRAKRSLWWLVWLGAFEAAFLFVAPFLPDDHPPHQKLWPLLFVSWPVGLFFGAAILSMVSDLVRGQIRADAQGLTWRRGFGRLRHARWDEITDFYYSGVKSVRRVETLNGRLELSSAFENFEAIAALVAERATLVPTRAWGKRGVRSHEEWALSLGYWTKAQLWGAPIMSLMVASLVVPALVAGLKELFSMGVHPVSPDWFTVFGAALVVLLGVPIGTVFILSPALMWRGRRLAWSHQEEHLFLNANGLRFQSPTALVEATWEQVQGVTRLESEARPWFATAPVEFRIETTQGSFSLWHFSDATVWSRFALLLQQYKPQVLEPLEQQERERLQQASDLDAQRGIASEAGVQVWSYRSRETRFAFGCASFLLAFAPGLYLVTAYNAANGEAFAPSWPLFGALCATSALVIGAGWTWFYRARIVADGNGLEVRSLLPRPRRLRWEQVQGVGNDAFGEFVRGAGQRVYFARVFAPVRVEELRQRLKDAASTKQHPEAEATA